MKSIIAHCMRENFFARGSQNILNRCLCFSSKDIIGDFMIMSEQKNNEMRQIKAWDNRLPYKTFELINCFILQLAEKFNKNCMNGSSHSGKKLEETNDDNAIDNERRGLS